MKKKIVLQCGRLNRYNRVSEDGKLFRRFFFGAKKAFSNIFTFGHVGVQHACAIWQHEEISAPALLSEDLQVPCVCTPIFECEIESDNLLAILFASLFGFFFRAF